jgi:3-hydroxybutyryl-CoA dehydratase
MTEPGTAAPPARTLEPISLTSTVLYQGASGDFNPLHHDPLFAAEAGFERPVAVGMHLAGLMSIWLTDWLGPESVRRFSVRFRTPVLLGERLQVGGEVVERRKGEHGDELVVALWCRRMDDDVDALTGEATCLMTQGGRS